jgi:hypothetical protein
MSKKHKANETTKQSYKTIKIEQVNEDTYIESSAILK